MSTAPLSRNRKRALLIAMTSIVAVSLTACASGSGTAVATGGSTAALGNCGTIPSTTPADASNVLSALPADAQKGYQDFPYAVGPSKWTSYDGTATTKPIKFAFVTQPLANAFAVNAAQQVQDEVKADSASGLTDPNVTMEVMTGFDASEEVQLYQQAVSSGANVIITIPSSGPALVDAVNAAGAKGVLTVSLNTYIPSDYSINVMINPFLQNVIPIANSIKFVGGTGAMLMVNGIQGETNTQITSDGLTALLKDCPNMTLAGQVDGGYTEAGAKSAVQKFLTSYPGDLAVVGQTGVMGAGVISAFQQSGRTVPVVGLAGLEAGDASFWASSIANGYTTFGTGGTGSQVAHAAYQTAIRTMQGQGPKINNIVFYPVVITNDNVAQFVPAGADINTTGEITGDVDLLAPDALLSEFFTNPTAKK